MFTAPEHENAAASSTNTPSQLVAEISARLIEWSQAASRPEVAHWLDRLKAIHRADPAAMWLYLAWQTGDTSAIAKSFEDRGAARALPRQAVQQETARAFETLAMVAPELVSAMRETFEQHSPEARAAGDGTLDGVSTAPANS